MAKLDTLLNAIYTCPVSKLADDAGLLLPILHPETSPIVKIKSSLEELQSFAKKGWFDCNEVYLFCFVVVNC